MLHKYNYDNTCWWCGSEARSGEHKFKKAELIRYFGRGPYKGNSSVVRGVERKLRTVQGPNLTKTKFGENLCTSCNNSASQPFDRSYDRFAEFIHVHEERILESKELCFSDIYGKD